MGLAAEIAGWKRTYRIVAGPGRATHAPLSLGVRVDKAHTNLHLLRGRQSSRVIESRLLPLSAAVSQSRDALTCNYAAFLRRSALQAETSVCRSLPVCGDPSLVLGRCETRCGV